ncbi:HsdM family class I SAM-dependent methyltransferase [Acetobacter persici]|uniref:HsdM family class I SAM-dependent methyltransferase n=1 Tax=Acetobacter persici TaxID=1076596 RepID=UPI00211AF5C6|nr:N-6 DNA methylase [Acetobacter persici]
MLGDAYEYLIKKFADATNKKAGEFYTPRSVVRLMIDMLAPKEAETIYKPACGTDGMLLAAVQHLKEQHGEPPTYFSARGCTNCSSEDLTSLGMVFFMVSDRSCCVTY